MSTSTGPTKRQAGAASTSSAAAAMMAEGQHADLLAQYDDLDTPLDSEQQDRLLSSLAHQNQSSNYGLRMLLVVLITITIVAYLTPIPAYIRGDHPENHLTLYHHPMHVEGTPDHLTYLPALPIYLAFFALHASLLYMALVDLLTSMGHAALLSRYRLPLSVRTSASSGSSLPPPSHPFGTAPHWLVPTLRDLKWSTSPQTKLHVRADQQQPDAAHRPQTLAGSLRDPRLLYLWLLFIASWPLPMLVFGAGNFANAAWWAISSGVLGVVLVVESWMAGVESELVGLSGLKYDLKSA